MQRSAIRYDYSVSNRLLCHLPPVILTMRRMDRVTMQPQGKPSPVTCLASRLQCLSAFVPHYNDGTDRCRPRVIVSMPTGIHSSLQLGTGDVTIYAVVFQCLPAFIPHYNSPPSTRWQISISFQCLPAFIPHYNRNVSFWDCDTQRFNAYRHSFLITTCGRVGGYAGFTVSMPTGIHSSLQPLERRGTMARNLFQCLPAFIPHYNRRFRWGIGCDACFNAYRHSFLITTASLRSLTTM